MFLDLTNKVFGWVTAIKVVGRDTQRGMRWLCKCRCGKLIVRARAELNSGKTVSCGCFFNRKRGGKHTHPAYRKWRSMLARCRDKRDKDYGGRGIKVCKRWLVFENFAKDMGSPPPALTLGRINNNKGYSPENCRWETYKQQTRNYRRNVLLTARGKTMSAVDWAEELKIPAKRIYARVQLGWHADHVLFDPPSIHHNRRQRTQRHLPK